MSEEQTIYKPGDDLRTLSERNEEELALTFLRGLQLMAGEHYDCPEFTLEQNGVGFAPLGNIMAICAEMKNGKTWLMLSLAAALLKGQWGQIKATCEAPRVLWFDTEQDKYDTMLILRRIHQMCEWHYNTDNPQFQIFNLRDIKFDKRREAVMTAIKWLKPTIVFVDGIRDLVQSVNEEQECYELINDFMAVTARYHCSIWSVLHVNPNSDKMRGHLGTELGNKTTDVFNVKKEKDKNTGDITFTVEQVAARHRDVDGWSFAIQDFPGTHMYSIPVMLTPGEVQQVAEDRWHETRNKFAKYMPNEMKAYRITELREAIKNGEHIGTTKALRMIADATAIGAIEQVVGGGYRLKHKPPTNDMPEEQIEAPF